eukprot:GILK01005964.1.p1 GENE.GILK01005964.1~~GILK01005964.1.p1  ORF type:complete len:605 (-),score=156.02 GILK01005964.1:90-1904(-)
MSTVDDKELEKRLSKAKEARLLASVSDTALAEATKDDEANNAASWVAKMRMADEEKKKRERELVEQKAKMLEEMDEETENSVKVDRRQRRANRPRNTALKSLKGVKVAHGLEELADDQEVILTLKDTNILAGDGVNEDADELENIHLQEKARLEQKFKTMAQRTFYDPTDPDSQSSILNQYDDEKKKQGFTLDESGNAEELKQQRADAIRARLSSYKEGGKQVVSLDTELKFTSDYYTVDELTKFKKKKKVVKRKPKLSDIFGEDELAAPEADLGSRRQREGETVKDQDKARRQQGYDKALEKAHEETRSLFQTSSSSSSDQPHTATVLEDDDFDINQFLQKQRRQAELGGKKPEERIKELLQASSQVKMEDSTGDSGILFTETTEFVRAVQPVEESKPRSSVWAPTPKPVKQEPKEGQASGWQSMQVDATANGNGTTSAGVKDEEMADADAPQEESEEEDLGLLEEAQVGSGVAAALSLLRSKGELQQQRFVGRAKDEKNAWNADEDRIRLSYTDANGRQLTQKEAYRQISWKFHGKGPSQNKLEKKMLKELAEEKSRTANPTDLKSVKALQRAQELTGSAYMVLSGSKQELLDQPKAKRAKK